jgi:hypothetical protein
MIITGPLGLILDKKKKNKKKVKLLWEDYADT